MVIFINIVGRQKLLVIESKREQQLLDALNNVEEQGGLVAEHNQGLVKQQGFDASEDALKIKTIDQHFYRLSVFVRDFVKVVFFEFNGEAHKVYVGLRVENRSWYGPQKGHVHEHF